MTYKEYVDNYQFPTNLSGDSILQEEFRLDGILQFNARKELDLTMEDLYRADPRAALHILLGVLNGGTRIASKQVYLALLEAFHYVIDFSNGGLTPAGHAKYTYDCGWLKAEAGAHRSSVEFEKIQHDPEAVAAWPKGVVANLGGRARDIAVTTTTEADPERY